MILFPFATQATEPAPGASIEEPRVRHTNLAAYLAIAPPPLLSLVNPLHFRPPGPHNEKQKPSISANKSVERWGLRINRLRSFDM